jgi:phage protein D
MFPGEFFTWARSCNVAIVDGRIPAEEMRQRTLSLTYVDRDRNFDHIEWELDNRDGKLTRPEFLATGMVVRVQLGYQDGVFPWKAFIINRVKGGIGVQGKQNPAIGLNESVVTFHGRNRNARGGRTARPWNRRARAPGKRKKVYGSTLDITSHEMVLNHEQGPTWIDAATTSQAVEEIARRNGFDGSYALIEPTYDTLDGHSVMIPKTVSDAEFLQSLASSWGYIFKIDEYGLHWHSQNWSGAKHRVVDRLVYGETPDILEMSIDADFRLPAPSSMSARSYNFRRRVMITHDAAFDENQKTANLAMSYFDQLNDPTRFRALTRHEVFPALADNLTKAEKKTVQRFIMKHTRAFALNISTVGNPKLLAGRIVEIDGTGNPIVDGLKYISVARHRMQSATYTTELRTTYPPQHLIGKMQVGLVQDPAADKNKGQLNMGVLYARGWPQIDAPPELRR